MRWHLGKRMAVNASSATAICPTALAMVFKFVEAAHRNWRSSCETRLRFGTGEEKDKLPDAKLTIAFDGPKSSSS
jgi:hypothetical protein